MLLRSSLQPAGCAGRCWRSAARALACTARPARARAAHSAQASSRQQPAGSASAASVRYLSPSSIKDAAGLCATAFNDVLSGIWLAECSAVVVGAAELLSTGEKAQLEELARLRGFRVRLLEDGQQLELSLPPAAPHGAGAPVGTGPFVLAKSGAFSFADMELQLRDMQLQPGQEAVFKLTPDAAEARGRLRWCAHEAGYSMQVYRQYAAVRLESDPLPKYRPAFDPDVMDLVLQLDLPQGAVDAAHGHGVMARQSRAGSAGASDDEGNPNRWYSGPSSTTSTTSSLQSIIDTTSINGNNSDASGSEDEGAAVDEAPWWGPEEAAQAAGSSVGGSASKTAQAPSKHSAQRSARSAQRTSSVRKRDRLSKALQQQQLKRRRTQQSARMWRQRKSLPVYAQRQHIMKTIAANQVTIISGETGSGKSTQIPQYLIESAISAGRGAEVSVLVTQPRRISAISLAQRVAAERAEEAGDVVGHKVRLDALASRRTRLLFCTAGIVLRILIVNPLLEGVSHIVLDEVHERGTTTDFLLIALKDVLAKRPDLKVVLMSATLDADIFSAFFDPPAPHVALKGRTFPVQDLYLEDFLSQSNWRVHTDKERVKAFLELRKWRDAQQRALEAADKQQRLKEQQEAGGDEAPKAVKPIPVRRPMQARTTLTQVPLKVEKRESGPQFASYEPRDWHCGYELEDEDFPGVDRRVLNSMTNWLSHTEDRVDIYLTAAAVRHIHKTGESGAILVILPGWNDIEHIYSLLTCGESVWQVLARQDSKPSASGQAKEPTQPEAEGVVDGMLVVPMHGALEVKEQQRAFMPPPEGARKVVLATNIAETSITIDDVVYVIDSGRHNARGYDPINKLAMLQGSWISQASAEQRRGRAGRVRPGVCLRLYPRPFMAVAMAPQDVPELQRIALEEVCLQVLALGLGDPPAFLARALSPPSPLAVRTAMEVLVELGAVETRSDSDSGQVYGLTSLGVYLAQLPVEPRTGKMLVYGAVLGCLEPILTVAAAASGQSPFVKTSTFEAEGALAKRRELALMAGDACSDHLALLEAVKQYQAVRRNGGGLFSWQASSMWCYQNYIDERNMQNMLALRKQLAELLADTGLIGAPTGDDMLGSQALRLDDLDLGGYIDETCLPDNSFDSELAWGGQQWGGQQQRQQQQQQGEGDSSRLLRGLELQAAVRAASFNAVDTELVKAVLVAGLYPHVAMVQLLFKEPEGGGVFENHMVRQRKRSIVEALARQKKGQAKGPKYDWELRTLSDGVVSMSSQSLVRAALGQANSLGKKPGALWLPHRWLVFSEKMLLGNSDQPTLSMATPVSDAAVLLFGGSLHVTEADAEGESEEAGSGVATGGGAEADCVELSILSGLVRYHVPRAHAEGLMHVRQRLLQMIQSRIEGEGGQLDDVDVEARVSTILHESMLHPWYVKELM